MAKKKLKKKKATKQPDLKANSYDQERSLLFQLPRELRDEIYSLLFYSTRFAYGERATTRISHVRIKSIPNALALLRTCRRAKEEIGDTWLGQALFSFEDPETMLDKLTAIPTSTLSKIRHLRVRGDPLMLSYPGDEHDVYYRLASTLKLLPCLRLDRLTVLGCTSKEVRYDTLNRLIMEGEGWKELHYISHDSAMLGYAEALDAIGQRDRYVRKPQPAHWQSLLVGRDGASSTPSVTIYRSILPGCTGAVVNSATRERYEQKPPDGEKSQNFGLVEDPSLMADGERDKEIIVIAKRGTGVDYEEKRGSPFLEIDIRREMPGKTWKEIRAVCIDRFADMYEDLDWPFSDEDEEPAEVDSYKHISDYVWTPLHFNVDADLSPLRRWSTDSSVTTW
jgi:hypothetical protein